MVRECVAEKSVGVKTEKTRDPTRWLLMAPGVEAWAREPEQGTRPAWERGDRRHRAL